MATDAGVARLQAKLAALLDQRKAYEAQQMAQTLQRRLAGQQRDAEGRAVLEATARALLVQGDAPTGAALAVQWCDALRADAVPADEALVARVAELASLFPRDAAGAAGRAEYFAALFRYASSPACAPALEQRLRAAAADTELASGQYAAAHPHAVRANNGRVLGAVLRGWAADPATLARERDLIVARGILEALAHGFVVCCDEAFAHCVPAFGTTSPLLNFVGYLLRTVRHPGAAPLFTELKQRYSAALERDPAFEQLLQAIGAKVKRRGREGRIPGRGCLSHSLQL